MDNIQFNPVPTQPAPTGSNCTINPNINCDLRNLIQNARQNPQWLEQEVKRINPQGYQQALQIKNSANPIQVIMQMAQANRVHPSILQMLGIR
jgi:hypothetical protein